MIYPDNIGIKIHKYMGMTFNVKEHLKNMNVYVKGNPKSIVSMKKYRNKKIDNFS